MKRDQEMSDLNRVTKIQELEALCANLEKKLSQERERNRALRFKAGQFFLQAISENAQASVLKNLSAGKKKGEGGDYYL